jgi:hypothetical protein
MRSVSILVRALLLASVVAEATIGQALGPRPIAAVIPTVLPDSANAVLTLGVVALLETELRSGGRVAVVSASNKVAWSASATDSAALRVARSRGAAYAVIVGAERVGASLRAGARVVARRGEVRVVDSVTSDASAVLTLVVELASSIRDFVLPDEVTRGGPVFRPPRPSVPYPALALYSKPRLLGTRMQRSAYCEMPLTPRPNGKRPSGCSQRSSRSISAELRAPRVRRGGDRAAAASNPRPSTRKRARTTSP